ncbi:MAG: hypothetical protein KGN84_13635, partial [Acidobacteriota bacterium]|nr:hypothetical protein [Acidobacteriota bacterium]
MVTAVQLSRQRGELSRGEEFFASYRWALNIYPTLGEALRNLTAIAGERRTSPIDWMDAERRLNIALLACAVSDTVDDEIAGPFYDFSKVTGALPFAAPLTNLLGRALLAPARLKRGRDRLSSWRREWELAVVDYMRAALLAGDVNGEDVAANAERLARLAKWPHLPLPRRCKAPAAFRSQDLTHFDAIALARRFSQGVSDRTRPVLVLGCRTAGSYFAPLVRAQLILEGFENVESVTIRPKNPASSREAASMAQAAARGSTVLLVDEPVNTGSTLIKAIQRIVSYGTKLSNIALLLPVHASRRNWASGADAAALASVRTILLEPEDWHKYRMLDEQYVHGKLTALAPGQFGEILSVEPDAEISASIERGSDLKFHSRLMRGYRVRSRDAAGRVTVDRVMAKSVGWGWYSYHAALAGEALEGFVPKVFGVRDGILFAEWVDADGEREPERIVSIAADYIATRATKLALMADPVPDLARANQHKGTDELAGILSKAYGSKPGALLRRPAIVERLSATACPVPALIDGRMRQGEWIFGGQVSKADFEHHGLGKTELSVTDPAYDLADAILHWRLNPDQERQLISEYQRQSGDENVEQRLFRFKLLAGAWTMSR